MGFIVGMALALGVGSASSLTKQVCLIDDFEKACWDGTVRSADCVKQGQYAAKWVDLENTPRLRIRGMVKDWSRYDRLVFWMHSAEANNQRLTLVCGSENKASDGWDYYFHHITVDWQGWRRFDLRLGSDVRATRSPRGWDQIDYVMVSASGWNHHPLPDTRLHIDDVKLVRDTCPTRLEDQRLSRTPDGGARWTYRFCVTNRTDAPRAFDVDLTRESTTPEVSGLFRCLDPPTKTPVIEPNDGAMVEVVLAADADQLRSVEPLTSEAFAFHVHPGLAALPSATVALSAVAPLPEREHPFLFGSAEVFERAKDRAKRLPWAKRQAKRVVGRGRSLLRSKLNVPDEPGQWTHHYVCKKCGNRLKHEAKAGKHVCKGCGAEYTGWPYDQVVLTRVHAGNWSGVRDLGLAYALSGEEAFAERARAILLAYADTYTSYPLHNVRGKESRSAGRVFAQTLDESVYLVSVAWGYDLIFNSPCLSDADKQHIENDFLREAVKTVRRYNAGISNWQSWHNAGMAAVGFTIEDEEIAHHAINGKAGLRFQFVASVLPDGFWYEGTAAYHYYALKAIRFAAEAAHHAGINVYAEGKHKALYLAPIEYVFPDMRFPAVNDSDVFSITGQDELYELAYARWTDPKFLLVARHGKRNSLEALLYGPEELPEPPALMLRSKDFAGLGAVVLRQGHGPDQFYLHLDYGPHGGGHGHPDKMAIILFALGRQLAPDPARLPYAAPMHRTWYKQTFSHNTVCIDGRSQWPATGTLTFFDSRHGLAVARAECDRAYRGVMLRRTVALTDAYVVDVFEVAGEAEHEIDWLYHNFGALAPRLDTAARDEPLGTTHGYQHLKDISEAATDETWQADFLQDDANVRVTMVGRPGTRLFFGVGMSGNPPKPCPMIVARRKAERTTYVSVIEPYKDKPGVSAVELVAVETGEAKTDAENQAEPVALRLQRSDGGEDMILLAPKAGVEHRFAGQTSTARACLIHKRPDGDLHRLELE